MSNSTKALLDLLYTNIPNYEVRFASVQQQQDNTSCGRWAIAYAFDLALGHDPAATEYDEAEMADHLQRCFDQGCVMAFPGIRHVPTSLAVPKSINDAICKGCGASVKQLMKHLAKKHNC